MKQLYLFKPLISRFLFFFSLCFSCYSQAQFIEDFEDEIPNHRQFTSYFYNFILETQTSSTDPGFRFFIADPTDIEGVGIGYNDSDKYIHVLNDFNDTWSIRKEFGYFSIKSFYLFVSGSDQYIPGTNRYGNSSEITIRGKREGVTQFTITKNSGWISFYPPHNGFVLIDFTTEGGNDNSNKAIDEIEFDLGADDNYFAVDNFVWGLSANTPPTASDFSPPVGPYENLTHTFTTSDFGYSDSDGDPLSHIGIKSTPTEGTLYVDADNDDIYDPGEEVSVNDQISKANLDAGHLQYIQNGSADTSFQFEVNDGTENSSRDYYAYLTVNPVPTVTLSLSETQKSESITTSTSLIATLSNAYGEQVVVNLGLSGTASFDSDYTASGTSITIPIGFTSGDISLVNQNDNLYEGNETVVMDIISVTNGIENGTQQQTFTIVDDDPKPTATLEVLSDYNPITDESGGQAYVRGVIDAIAAVPVNIPLSFSGTAQGGGEDYSITGSVINIKPGHTMDSIRVTSKYDEFAEGNETIIITMGTPTNAEKGTPDEVMLTIIDEDNTPPAGYSVTIDQDPITSSNASGVSFTFAGAEVGSTYNYTFSTSGGATTVTGSGTIASASDQITGIDLSGLEEGTIGLSLTLKDNSGNVGEPATDTAVKVPNNAPVVTAPSISGVQEDVIYNIPDDIQVADIDGDDLTLTFTVIGGTVTLGTTGITFGGLGNGSASFTAEGSLNDLNNALDAATFVSDLNLNGADAGTISFVANDGFNDSNLATVTFSIAWVSDAPTWVGDNIRTASYTENGTPAQFNQNGLWSITEPDGDQVTDATLEFTNMLPEDVLTINVPGPYAMSGNGKIFTLTGSGTASQMSTALESITFSNTGKDPSGGGVYGVRYIDVIVKDLFGNESIPMRLSIQIVAVNDDPTLTGLPTDITFQDGVPGNVNLSSVTFEDPDSGAGSVQLQFLVSGGTLTGSSNGGVTFSNGAIPGTWIISGTAANIDTYLDDPNNIQFTNTPGSIGDNAGSISITANDNGNTGSGGGVSVSLGTVNLDVLNSSPVIDIPVSSTSYTEDNPPISIAPQLIVIDANNQTLVSAAISITSNHVSDQDILGFVNDGSTMGNILASYNASVGILTLTSSGATASISEWQEALQAVTYVNNSQAPDTANRMISFIVNDGVTNSNTATKSIAVTAVNDDPVMTGLPALITVEEDADDDVFDISSATIADIDAENGELTLTLKATGGIFDTAAGLGITISGHLTNMVTLIGNLTNLNNYINDPANIYYIPDANISGNGVASVDITINDNGNTGEGGGNYIASGTIIINVTPVNDAPNASFVAISGTYIVGEVLNGTYTYSDVDNDTESGSSFQWYRSDDNAGTAKTTISGAITNSYTLQPADEGKYISFEVTPNDGNDAGIPVESTLVGPVKVNQVITFPGIPDKTYGDNTFTLGDAHTDQGLIVTYTATDPTIVSISGNQATVLKAGSTTITASQAGDATRNPASDVIQLLSVNQAVLSVRADNQNKVYGDADPVFTYQAIGFKGADDASILSGTLARIAGENIGTYAINQGNLSSGPNYTINFTGADFTITKATLNIIVDAGQTKVFGDADPVFTYQASGFKNGDIETVITGVLSRTAGEDIGTYPINLGTLYAGDNYALNYTGADFTIEEKVLTVTADTGQSKAYGEADPVFTYQATGFEGGDDISILTGSLQRDPGENVGTYAINPGTLNAGPNYTINFTGADFEITRAALTITADNKNKIYGETDPALTVTYDGFVNGDDDTTLGGMLNLSRVSGEDTGNYTITATGYISSNYTITYADGSLEILPAALTVTADAGQTKAYGETDPVFSYTTTGLTNGDTSGILTGSLTRESGEDVGVYEIHQGSLTAGTNYTIMYTGVLFEITPSDQQISWTQDLSLGCGASDQLILTGTSDSGLPVAYVVDNTSIASVEGNILTIHQSGTTTITAYQEGDLNYNSATAVANTLLVSQTGIIRQQWEDVLVFDNSSASFVSWQWYKNGSAINGATKQYYAEEGGLNGTYYAEATDSNGHLITSCPLTISGAVYSRKMAIMPNPVSGLSEFTIRLDYSQASLNQARISIYDLSGRELSNTTTVTGETIMQAPQQPGLYVVLLSLSGGTRKSVNLLVR